jgi:sugar/nucleoside kinase (ribokinase family)
MPDATPVETKPTVDVFLSGTAFLDIIFTGLTGMPVQGTEVFASGMGSAPGGVANLAIAASRLGLRTALAAAFSTDAYGDFCWTTLAEQEDVDLSCSRRFEHWHSPVTVSMAVSGDRAMVTHAHPAPLGSSVMCGTAPRARAIFADLNPTGGDDWEWVQAASGAGALVFTDIGWDETGAWSPQILDRLQSCHAFLPNAREAMSYTRTSTVREALYRLADLVPLAVVTDGANGALAIDSTTGEEASVPALRVEAIDATGAGDVFAAAMIHGTLAAWPLDQRLSFAALCSALAVQQFGGSLSAPGLGDILDWWRQQLRSTDDSAYAKSLRHRYGFLGDLAPTRPIAPRRRAAATLARLADLGGQQ